MKKTAISLLLIFLFACHYHPTISKEEQDRINMWFDDNPFKYYVGQKVEYNDQCAVIYSREEVLSAAGNREPFHAYVVGLRSGLKRTEKVVPEELLRVSRRCK